MKELYVVSCCRTAVGKFQGSLTNVAPADMGAIVVKEAIKRANIAPENVDEVMFGSILTANQGQNVARQVCVKAGLPLSVPAYTVGMVCGSGMPITSLFVMIAPQSLRVCSSPIIAPVNMLIGSHALLSCYILQALRRLPEEGAPQGCRPPGKSRGLSCQQ